MAARATAPAKVILERVRSIYSEVDLPGLIPGMKPPYLFILSAKSRGLKIMAV